MANLMIGPQQAPSIKSPQVTSNAMPADVKVAGKNASQLKEEAKTSTKDFTASLKEGLSKEAKKEETKKTQAQELAAKQAAVLAQVLQGQAQAQPVVSEKMLSKEESAAALVAAKKNNAATGSSKIGQILNGKLQAELATAEKAQAQATKTDVPKASAAKNLNPLQQVMLEQNALQAGGESQKGAMAAQGTLAQALQASGQAPEFEHAFDVESITEGGALAAKGAPLSAKDELAAKRATASKVSTSDYLNLRDIAKNSPIMSKSESQLDLGTALKAKSGQKDKLAALGGKESFAGMLASRAEVGSHLKTIDAPVTQGGGAKTVLTHDTIHQVTQQVNLLSEARQDGEIKIRLRPDHLGELHMSVKAQGQQVSIEIKTQNSASKKIIEDSLASLKESLGQQNLTLARIDIVTAPAHAQSAAEQGTQFDMSQFRQNSGQNSGNSSDQGNQRQESLYQDQSAPVNLNTVRRAAQVSARGGQGLDLIA